MDVAGGWEHIHRSSLVDGKNDSSAVALVHNALVHNKIADIVVNMRRDWGRNSADIDHMVYDVVEMVMSVEVASLVRSIDCILVALLVDKPYFVVAASMESAVASCNYYLHSLEVDA